MNKKAMKKLPFPFKINPSHIINFKNMVIKQANQLGSDCHVRIERVVYSESISIISEPMEDKNDERNRNAEGNENTELNNQVDDDSASSADIDSQISKSDEQVDPMKPMKLNLEKSSDKRVPCHRKIKSSSDKRKQSSISPKTINDGNNSEIFTTTTESDCNIVQSSAQINRETISPSIDKKSTNTNTISGPSVPVEGDSGSCSTAQIASSPLVQENACNTIYINIFKSSMHRDCCDININVFDQSSDENACCNVTINSVNAPKLISNNSTCPDYNNKEVAIRKNTNIHDSIECSSNIGKSKCNVKINCENPPHIEQVDGFYNVKFNCPNFPSSDHDIESCCKNKKKEIDNCRHLLRMKALNTIKNKEKYALRRYRKKLLKMKKVKIKQRNAFRDRIKVTEQQVDPLGEIAMNQCDITLQQSLPNLSCTETIEIDDNSSIHQPAQESSDEDMFDVLGYNGATMLDEQPKDPSSQSSQGTMSKLDIETAKLIESYHSELLKSNDKGTKGLINLMAHSKGKFGNIQHRRTLSTRTSKILHLRNKTIQTLKRNENVYNTRSSTQKKDVYNSKDNVYQETVIERVSSTINDRNSETSSSLVEEQDNRQNEQTNFKNLSEESDIFEVLSDRDVRSSVTIEEPLSKKRTVRKLILKKKGKSPLFGIVTTKLNEDELSEESTDIVALEHNSPIENEAANTTNVVTSYRKDTDCDNDPQAASLESANEETGEDDSTKDGTQMMEQPKMKVSKKKKLNLTRRQLKLNKQFEEMNDENEEQKQQSLSGDSAVSLKKSDVEEEEEESSISKPKIPTPTKTKARFLKQNQAKRGTRSTTINMPEQNEICEPTVILERLQQSSMESATNVEDTDLSISENCSIIENKSQPDDHGTDSESSPKVSSSSDVHQNHMLGGKQRGNSIESNSSMGLQATSISLHSDVSSQNTQGFDQDEEQKENKIQKTKERTLKRKKEAITDSENSVPSIRHCQRCKHVANAISSTVCSKCDTYYHRSCAILSRVMAIGEHSFCPSCYRGIQVQKKLKVEPNPCQVVLDRISTVCPLCEKICGKNLKKCHHMESLLPSSNNSTQLNNDNSENAAPSSDKKDNSLETPTSIEDSSEIPESKLETQLQQENTTHSAESAKTRNNKRPRSQSKTRNLKKKMKTLLVLNQSVKTANKKDNTTNEDQVAISQESPSTLQRAIASDDDSETNVSTKIKRKTKSNDSRNIGTKLSKNVKRDKLIVNEMTNSKLEKKEVKSFKQSKKNFTASTQNLKKKRAYDRRTLKNKALTIHKRSGNRKLAKINKQKGVKRLKNKVKHSSKIVHEKKISKKATKSSNEEIECVDIVQVSKDRKLSDIYCSSFNSNHSVCPLIPHGESKRAKISEVEHLKPYFENEQSSPIIMALAEGLFFDSILPEHCQQKIKKKPGRKPNSLKRKKPKSSIQDIACIDFPNVSRCLECIESQSKDKTTPADKKKILDLCRFKNFRKIKEIKGTQHSMLTFICPNDKVSKLDKSYWTKQCKEAPKLDQKSAFEIFFYCLPFFEQLCKEEAELSCNLTPKVWRKFDSCRDICDLCKTTIFNLHWMCIHCGFAVCLYCYEEGKREDFVIAADSETLTVWDSRCNSLKRHFLLTLTLCQRIPRTIFGNLVHEVAKVCSSVLQLLPPLRVQNDFKTVKFNWMCNGKLLRIWEPYRRSNEAIFQQQWLKERPVIISGVTRKMNMSLWTPSAFLKNSGNTSATILDCLTLGKTTTALSAFWFGFEDVRYRLQDPDGGTISLKLKDWPPHRDFAEVYPERFNDLMNAMPLPQYTLRKGKYNLVSRLPPDFIPPDLGPKMYTAYSTLFAKSDCATTNLHLDASDAVNVLVYASIPEGTSREEFLRKIRKELSDEGTVDDYESRLRIEAERFPCKSEDELDQVGALWHIYDPKDSDSIRKFLLNIANERGDKIEPNMDPIHDQSWYLDSELRRRLLLEHNVQGYSFVQWVGDSVFIPAGAPHQVKNLKDCIKIAEDFVSPEHLRSCMKLTNEFRCLTDSHTNHEDKIQVRNIIYHTIKDCLPLVLKKRPYRKRSLKPTKKRKD